MPTYRHPRSHPPARVHVSRGDKRPVADDGTFDAPRHVAASIADHHGVSVADMRVDSAEGGDESTGNGGSDAGTCTEVKNDGEVCGRDLPCPYHSDD